MKVRNGYISNSSSSSFVIIGKQVLFNEIKPGDLIYVQGKEISDGIDIFELTDEIKEVMEGWKNKNRLNKFEFYKSRMVGKEFNREDTEIPDLELEDGDELIVFNKDYHSTVSLDDFENSYDDYYFEDEEKEDEYEMKGRYVPIIGTKIENILKEIKEERYKNLWCHIVVDEVVYMVKINNHKDYLKCQHHKDEKEFYHVRDFCDNGYKFRKGKLEKENLYWVYEEKRVNDIKEVKGL